jgi:hypothetical protein
MEAKRPLSPQALRDAYWEARLAPRGVERLVERREAERLMLLLQEALPSACSIKLRLHRDYGIITCESGDWLVQLRVCTDEERRRYEVTLRNGLAASILKFDDAQQACEGFARAAGEVGEDWVPCEPGLAAKVFAKAAILVVVAMSAALGAAMGILFLRLAG